MWLFKNTYNELPPAKPSPRAWCHTSGVCPSQLLGSQGFQSRPSPAKVSSAILLWCPPASQVHPGGAQLHLSSARPQDHTSGVHHGKSCGSQRYQSLPSPAQCPGVINHGNSPPSHEVPWSSKLCSAQHKAMVSYFGVLVSWACPKVAEPHKVQCMAPVPYIRGASQPVLQGLEVAGFIQPSKFASPIRLGRTQRTSQNLEKLSLIHSSTVPRCHPWSTSRRSTV